MANSHEQDSRINNATWLMNGADSEEAQNATRMRLAAEHNKLVDEELAAMLQEEGEQPPAYATTALSPHEQGEREEAEAARQLEALRQQHADERIAASLAEQELRKRQQDALVAAGAQQASVVSPTAPGLPLRHEAVVPAAVQPVAVVAPRPEEHVAPAHRAVAGDVPAGVVRPGGPEDGQTVGTNQPELSQQDWEREKAKNLKEWSGYVAANCSCEVTAKFWGLSTKGKTDGGYRQVIINPGAGQGEWLETEGNPTFLPETNAGRLNDILKSATLTVEGTSNMQAGGDAIAAKGYNFLLDGEEEDKFVELIFMQLQNKKWTVAGHRGYTLATAKIKMLKEAADRLKQDMENNPDLMPEIFENAIASRLRPFQDGGPRELIFRTHGKELIMVTKEDLDRVEGRNRFGQQRYDDLVNSAKRLTYARPHGGEMPTAAERKFIEDYHGVTLPER